MPIKWRWSSSSKISKLRISRLTSFICLSHEYNSIFTKHTRLLCLLTSLFPIYRFLEHAACAPHFPSRRPITSSPMYPGARLPGRWCCGLHADPSGWPSSSSLGKRHHIGRDLQVSGSGEAGAGEHRRSDLRLALYATGLAAILWSPEGATSLWRSSSLLSSSRTLAHSSARTAAAVSAPTRPPPPRPSPQPLPPRARSSHS